MPSRHAGTIASLLLTAALFLAMPGLLKTDADSNRMAQSLRPPKMRTLTVWLLPDGPDDRKLLHEICAAFEKANKGVRIFLRRVNTEELYAEKAVLPDAVLFATGEINRPEDVLLPLVLEHPHAGGQFAGNTYAIPLWYEPAKLCWPKNWGEDPWPALTQPGALMLPSGVNLQRLLLTCPEAWRQGLVNAALGKLPAPSVSPPKKDSVPPARGASPTPAPTVSGRAKIAPGPREEELSMPLDPETSGCVRFVSLCRDGTDAHAFLRFLQNWHTEFFACIQPDTVLPNAFAHTRQEIDELCLDGFSKLHDPALTLLKLR